MFEAEYSNSYLTLSFPKFSRNGSFKYSSNTDFPSRNKILLQGETHKELLWKAVRKGTYSEKVISSIRKPRKKRLFCLFSLQWSHSLNFCLSTKRKSVIHPIKHQLDWHSFLLVSSPLKCYSGFRMCFLTLRILKQAKQEFKLLINWNIMTKRHPQNAKYPLLYILPSV